MVPDRPGREAGYTAAAARHVLKPNGDEADLRARAKDHFGSEMPETASVAGRQKYPPAHGQDRAIRGVMRRSKTPSFDHLIGRVRNEAGSPWPSGAIRAGCSSVGLTGKVLNGIISMAVSCRCADRRGRPCLALFLESFRADAEIQIWTNEVGVRTER
jgi:hypothetical protein